MDGFMDMLKDPFVVFVIVIVGGGFLRALFYQWNVRRNGYETEATVTDVIERTMYNEGAPSYYYDVDVVYTTKDGKYRTGSLANVTREFEEGERIRIKYTDEDPDKPVYIGTVK